MHADLTPQSDDYSAICDRFLMRRVVMSFCFPPCTELAGSGSKHWAGKALLDPDFQTDAVRMASYCFEFAESLGGEVILENPVGALSRLWKRWSFMFDPYMYGGYLPEDDVHPRHPKYIAPRDAYPKKTCIWASPRIIVPVRKPVEPEVLERVALSGKIIRGSRQTILLGGKSRKTKAIRDETPRGFSLAFFQANSRVH